MLAATRLAGFGARRGAGFAEFAAADAATTDNAASASQTVNLPANLRPGNLVCIFFRTASTGTPTPPAGWSLLYFNTAGTLAIGCLWRVADGSEGATVTVTLAAAVSLQAVACRFAGARPVPVNDNAVASGSSTSPNGPLLDAGTGLARNVLWVTHVTFSASATTAEPGGYGNKVQAGTANCSCIATRNLAALTEDPGAWTLGTSRNWMAMTVAIVPAW
jgi:hypothetical protein